VVITVIRSLRDLRSTLEAPVYRVNVWSLPLADEQAKERDGTVAQVFARREEAAPAAADEARARYLDAVAQPLAELRRLGFQIVAVLTRGSYLVRSAAREPLRSGVVDIADYLIAPDPCYFRSSPAQFDDPIHALGADCVPGHTGIVAGEIGESQQKLFSIWTTREAVQRDFELAVPWCPVCRPGQERAA
jgi:hypothetical protein